MKTFQRSGLILLTVLLQSCYQEVPNISEDFGAGIHNQDSTEITFIKGFKAYFPPEGVTRFPDGGQPNMLLEKVYLYNYHLSSHQLKVIAELGHLKGFPSRWKNRIQRRNHWVVYSLTPVSLRDTNSSVQGLFIIDLRNASKQKIENFPEKFWISPEDDLLLYTLPKSKQTVDLYSYHLISEKKQLLNSGIPSIKNLTWLTRGKAAAILYNQTDTSIIVTTPDTSAKIQPRDTQHTRRNSRIQKHILKQLIQPNDYKQWDFPIFESFKRSKHELKKDVLELKGNQNYRIFALYRLMEISSPEELDQLSKSIEKKKKNLKNNQIFKNPYYDELFEILHSKGA